MENKIKLSKQALEQMLVDYHNKRRRGFMKDDKYPDWVEEVDLRWCEYDDIEGKIALDGVLTEVRGKKRPYGIVIELEKDLSEGFGEENNNYFVTLYRYGGKSDDDIRKCYEFKAELQEDFKEFLKKQRREKSE